MTLAIHICLGLAIAGLVVAVGWRLLSRRASLPCPSWLAWLVELENPFAKNYNASTIIEHLNLQPGMNVLDVGCGPGRVTIPLAQAIGGRCNVVALDMQPRMLERARAKAQSAHLTNIEFLEVAIDRGKFGNDQFDRVLLVTVLGEIPDRESALQEIYRALKPGGILSVTEIIVDPHYQSRRTILKLANAIGLREKAFYGSWFAFTIQLEK